MYQKVLPRDLFNVAKLLKCLGKLVIEGERYGLEVEMDEYDTKDFSVEQGESGELYCVNIMFRKGGEPLYFHIPYNSRVDWPLIYSPNDNSDEVVVFTAEGRLTPDMVQVLK